jgi:hypothetical protein
VTISKCTEYILVHSWESFLNICRIEYLRDSFSSSAHCISSAIGFIAFIAKKTAQGFFFYSTIGLNLNASNKIHL